MPNLTTEKSFVKPVLGVHPIAGHDLVVFRKVNGGQRFHSQLGPTDTLGLFPKLFYGSTLVAYAVTRDQSLRHTVRIEELKSADHFGPFALEVMLALSIAGAQLLVERLEDDPLSRLASEVQTVLGRAASRMEWSRIQAPPGDFEHQLLTSETELDETGKPISSQAFLQAFAKDLGLRLKRIQVARQFSADVGEATRVAWREQERRRIDQEVLESELLKKQLENRQREYEAWQTNTLGNIQRLGAISASATENLEKVLNQIADKVDTVPGLRTVMNELIAMRDEIAQLSSVGGGPAPAGLREMKVVGALSPAAMLTTSAPSDPVTSLLDRLSTRLGSISWEPADRSRLYSSLLRLAGELARQGEADSQVLVECRRSIKEQVPRLIKSVQTPEQRDLLLRLDDPEWLRSELAQG